MGRRKGSLNKKTIEKVSAIEPVVQINNDTVKIETVEQKKESYIERYNRPLPFTLRPFCFGTGLGKKG